MTAMTNDPDEFNRNLKRVLDTPESERTDQDREWLAVQMAGGFGEGKPNGEGYPVRAGGPHEVRDVPPEQMSDIEKEIAAIAQAVDELQAKLTPHVGQMDFTSVRLDSLMQYLVEFGIITKEQFNEITLAYAKRAHQQFIAIAQQVDQALRQQRMNALAQGVGQVDLSQLRRPQGR